MEHLHAIPKRMCMQRLRCHGYLLIFTDRKRERQWLALYFEAEWHLAKLGDVRRAIGPIQQFYPCDLAPMLEI